MEYFVFFTMAMGILIGAIFGSWLSKLIAYEISKLSFSPHIVLTCATVSTVLILLPAIALSFMIGGTFGGGVGEAVNNSFGLELRGASIGVGLAVGIAFVLGVSLAIGSLIGSLFGWLLSYALSKLALTRRSSGTPQKRGAP